MVNGLDGKSKEQPSSLPFLSIPFLSFPPLTHLLRLSFCLISHPSGYLKHHKLIQRAPLSALKDTRLGIDLEVYLRGVLSNPATAEPVVAALGGSPLALISHIENDLRSLERARIKPVFVLSGLPPAPSPTSNPSQKNRSHPQPRPPPASATAVAHKFFSEEEWKMNERSKAWEYYSQADQDSMNAAFARSNSLEILDLVRNVLRALRHRNVEYLVAPYMASGQVSEGSPRTAGSERRSGRGRADSKPR